jgi:hypothetical protein
LLKAKLPFVTDEDQRHAKELRERCTQLRQRHAMVTLELKASDRSDADAGGRFGGGGGGAAAAPVGGPVARFPMSSPTSVAPSTAAAASMPPSTPSYMMHTPAHSAAGSRPMPMSLPSDARFGYGHSPVPRGICLFMYPACTASRFSRRSPCRCARVCVRRWGCWLLSRVHGFQVRCGGDDGLGGPQRADLRALVVQAESAGHYEGVHACRRGLARLQLCQVARAWCCRRRFVARMSLCSCQRVVARACATSCPHATLAA